MSAPLPVVPVWRHCWECMLEVTPSGRYVVDRYTSMVDEPGAQRAALLPVTREWLERMCENRKALARRKSVAPWTPTIDWGGV